jgi:hypothetical protein
MKSTKFLLLAALIGVLFTYSGCKKSSGPGQSPQDAQLVKLSKTWKCTAVTLDNSAQTGYSSFALTISSTAGQTTFNYTTTGRPALSPWGPNGTFTYGTDYATQLTRDDSLPITYSVSDTQLQMTFNYTGAGIPGRVSNVKGNWVFTFGL